MLNNDPFCRAPFFWESEKMHSGGGGTKFGEKFISNKYGLTLFSNNMFSLSIIIYAWGEKKNWLFFWGGDFSEDEKCHSFCPFVHGTMMMMATSTAAPFDHRLIMNVATFIWNQLFYMWNCISFHAHLAATTTFGKPLIPSTRDEVVVVIQHSANEFF